MGLSLRTSGEWFDLLLAFFLVTIVVLLIGIITFGTGCCWMIVGFAITIGVSWVENKSMNEKARITARNDPRAWGLLSTTASRLSMNPPPVYVSSSASVNAFARGVMSPIIVINQGLINIMDHDELVFTIGHEMGHVKLHHTPLHTLFGSGMVAVNWLVYLPMLLFRMFFLSGRMSRSMEHSADRAGLHACQNIEASVRCLLKLKKGTRHLDERLVADALAMRLTTEDRPGLGDDLQRLLSTHPDMARRVNRLVKYSRDTGVGWPRTG